MSNLLKHAKHELSLIGGADDEYQQAINKGILDIVEIFAAQGHSGSSAPYAIGILEKLLSFEPLTPLTGKDDEWNEVDPGVWQNRRCSHVFKGPDGAFDSEGRIFRDKNGSCWQNHDSRVPVTFPYVPKREYVDREADYEQG